MRCAQCPISLVCWSGQLEVTDGSRTFLCPYCGNFACSSFKEDEERDEHRAGMRGFHCELRPLTDDIRHKWRLRESYFDSTTMKIEKRPNEIRIQDPAGFSRFIFVRPCPFCRSGLYDEGGDMVR